MLEKLAESSSIQLSNTQIFDEKKANEIKQSDTKLVFELQADRQSRREVEAATKKVIDEKLFGLKLDLTKEKKAREDMQDRFENTLGSQLIQLGEAIIEENKDREENS
jgi:hypothetical protein